MSGFAPTKTTQPASPTPTPAPAKANAQPVEFVQPIDSILIQIRVGSQHLPPQIVQLAKIHALTEIAYAQVTTYQDTRPPWTARPQPEHGEDV